ncbi:MAG: helix-turn-helix domain-containing protein [Candidatus Cryptobacteroides sp.]
MEKNNIENIPLWGLKTVTVEDIKQIGSFWALPKSGFFLCLKGSLALGSQNRFYELEPNDIIIYPIRTVVYIKGYSADITGIVGVTELEDILTIASQTVDMSQSQEILSNPYRHLNGREMEHIADLCLLLQKRLSESNADLEDLVLKTLWKALCYEIAMIFKSGKELNTAETSRGEAILLNFIFSLKEQVKTHREVQYYADEQRLTTRYFSTVIKKTSGITPSEWINTALMNLSKELLTDPDVNIKQVAYSLGFPNPSFFGKWFKHQCGITPYNFRKALK